MVYIGNIFKAHQGLREGFEIQLNYKSCMIGIIKKEDNLQKKNGDLKVTRYYDGKFHCAVIIDCNEVESMIIHKK